MSMKRILLAAALLAAVSCGRQPSGLFTITGGQTVTNCSWGHVELAPGEEKTLCEISGPGALRYFYITDGPEFITDEALVLRFYWDGADYPSVNVPAADFFDGRPSGGLVQQISGCASQFPSVLFPHAFQQGGQNSDRQ